MLDDIVASALARMDRDGTGSVTVTVTVEINRPEMSNKDITVQVESTSPSDLDGLTHSQRAVIGAVEAGHSRPSQIEQATGLKHRQIAYLLKELVGSGHLLKPRYGRYRRAA